MGGSVRTSQREEALWPRSIAVADLTLPGVPKDQCSFLWIPVIAHCFLSGMHMLSDKCFAHTGPPCVDGRVVPCTRAPSHGGM